MSTPTGAQTVNAFVATVTKPPKDRDRKWFWTWGALFFALLLAAAGSTGIGLSVGGSTFRPTLLLLSIILILGGFGLNVANQVRGRRVSQRDAERRVKHLTRFNDELSSVLQVVIELLRSARDEDASKQFFAAALREARHLVSHDGVRICVYKLDEREVENEDGIADEKWLRLEAFGGRGDPPRPDFTLENEHGKAVLDIAEGTRAVPINDPATATVATDHGEHAVWQSVLLVPLKNGTKALGVLMIDTREQVKFSAEDVSVGWTISAIVALGMDTLRAGGKDTRPELASLFQRVLDIRTGGLPGANDASESKSDDNGDQGNEGGRDGEHS